MKYKALAAAIGLASTNLYALEGKVVDSFGNPISNAKITTTFSKYDVLTNETGQFEVADDVEELHITAPGYSHRIVHLHEYIGDNLVITLPSTVIEQVDVIGLPIHASIIESALPVAVLSGETLRNQQAATLGDTLERQPGVNSNFHGSVASTPVIRGLSGPRVLITQNSLDVSDVSRVGPDHAVASEVSTAQQVEILRGPATLFYGSGAIGGVVNVVDERVPTDSETRGEILLSHDTVNSQNLASFNAITGTQSWAFYADGFWRDADDYEVPIAPEQETHDDEHEDDKDEHVEETFVANSAEESSGFTLGTSYLLDNGFVGIAMERLNREYGIPGHSHGGHEDEAEGEEEAVYANLKQDRFQLQSELTLDSPWVRAINTRAAYTDYTHVEFENGEAGTTFSNQTSELRLDLLHQEWGHWKGGINLHYKLSEVSAEGEEAFTPPSKAETFAIALIEEKHIGNVLLQFGARVEQVNITAENVLLPPLEAYAHASEDKADKHEHDDGDSHAEEIRVFAVDQEFTPISFSVGVVWDFTPGYNVGVALSHAQRAPSASELFSFGPHIGTRTYEIGALFDLHKEGNEAHFELNDEEIRLETSNNIDLTFRKHEGDLGIILNAYFNKIDNYYHQQATGLFTENGHEHKDDDSHDDEADTEEDEHADELPIFLFTHEDAEFYGLEAQLLWKLNNQWQTAFFSDFVHAELTDDRYLPRTPPLRFGADIDFTYEHLKANVNWTHYAKQDKVAELESSTKSYNMLDASVTYPLPQSIMDLSVFIKVENLTDTEARVHTSFIKDVAPRPGRNFSLGFHGSF